ncbi:MAG: hypothetical protein NT062_20165 [Proteobacteria bacterium]|nr:hypothetical protein [Pseudomonadota bacterium]
MTRFSEWVSALSPTTFTMLALVLFVGVFVAVVTRMFMQSRAEHDAWARLPLDNDGGES